MNTEVWQKRILSLKHRKKPTKIRIEYDIVRRAGADGPPEEWMVVETEPQRCFNQAKVKADRISKHTFDVVAVVANAWMGGAFVRDCLYICTKAVCSPATSNAPA